MKRSNYYIIIGIGLFIIYAIYFQLHTAKLLSIKGRYTIGRIEKIKPSGEGIRVYISFFYKDTKREVDYIEDIGKIKGIYMGKRLFIKFIPDDPDRSSDFNLNCSVPDSLKTAPPEGWSQEWIQKNFPNCIL